MSTENDFLRIKSSLEELDQVVQALRLGEECKDKKEETISEAKRFVTSLIQEALVELKTVHSNEDLKYRPKFIQAAALVILATFCPADTLTVQLDGCQKDSSRIRFLGELLSSAFLQISCWRSSSPPNRGRISRPRLRKLPAVKGDDSPNLMWRYSDVSAELPDRYSSKITLATAMSLLLTELSKSFLKCQFKSAEIPCLIDLFKISSANNQNQIGSLIEEFYALVNVCLHEPYTHPEHSVTSETVAYDFSITNQNGKKIRYVSVKSINFNDRRPRKKPAFSFLSGEDELTVLLHDCNCREFCEQHPIWKLQIKLKPIPDDDARSVIPDEDGKQRLSKLLAGFKCHRKKDFMRILKAARCGTIYLVSGKLLFDLRFAFSSGSIHSILYCKEKSCLRRNLKCAIEEASKQQFEDEEGQNSSPEQIPAIVVDRESCA
ncbi:hypothetical protein BOX15_Mlig026431g3 [Macrostomum lignano]|uniref:Uncharacterized protein n=1 Tax=Macrostomum lignano TaxID=282301 RepID=A0A267GCG5_9PLAT|nr:hypothetical protein BOX15_Mlig026431g3 [Macrostomum lignano]